MLFFLLICFGFSAMCFYGLSAAQNPRTLGSRLMSVVGQYVVNIFVYLAVQGIMKFTDHSTLNNNRRVKLRKVGSCNWTRRRAYWLQKNVCRADYLSCARRSKTLAAQSFKIKATHTIASVNHPTISKSVPIRDSVVQRKETSVRRRLSKRRDLHGCRRAPSKPFPIYYTPKCIKKRLGCRRRCFNSGVDVGFVSFRLNALRTFFFVLGGFLTIVLLTSASCIEATFTLSGLPHLTASNYDISYKITLASYKSMRKESSFYPSRRVLWQNRHRSVLGGRFNKNSFYDDYPFSPKQEKEYFCPEPA